MTTGVRPEDKTVSANGLNLHYLDWGATGKPTLLFLHGLRGHAHSWDDVSSAMCQDFHVLALDQRGRGDSDWAPGGDYSTDAFVADLTGFCDALALDSFVLVGHSMGGRNGMAFTARYPDRVKKLVVVDIGPVIDLRGAKRITQEITELPEEFDSFEAVLAHQSENNRFASDAVLRRRVRYTTRELPNGKFGWRFDVAVREQRRNGTSAPSIDLWPALPKIACSTLIVRGGETDLLGADVARQMVETIPDARLVEVPRAGHMVFEDNPDGFIAAVRGFLE